MITPPPMTTGRWCHWCGIHRAPGETLPCPCCEDAAKRGEIVLAPIPEVTQ